MDLGARVGNGHADVRHCWTRVDGINTFYREAGPSGAPAVLLPHGYPCSSFQYRQLLPALGDRWRLVAPDFPGFGYSDTPDSKSFAYDFDGYAEFLQAFAAKLSLTRFALYLHDYGSQIGLRLAIRSPESIAALILQNGDIYEDTLGPKYDFIRKYWADPSLKNRAVLEAAVSEEGFRDEFVGEIGEDLTARVTPDLWKLHWPLMNTLARRQLAVKLMEGLRENLAWFPRYQAYLRERQPPTLIIWGPRDGYMPEPSARAYLRDLPQGELHLLEGGHWLLETNFDEAVSLIRDFLGRIHLRRPAA